jgi:hypothetical protein
MREALGIDIGGVIIARSDQCGPESDTSFASDAYLETPEVPGAIDAIGLLVDRRFGRRVFLVSKARPRARARTMRWLKHRMFFERTGVKSKQIVFCNERSEKEAICSRLGITHFIDDRVDVLAHLKSVRYLYLFETPSKRDRIPGLPSSTERVTGWNEVLRKLLPAKLSDRSDFG